MLKDALDKIFQDDSGAFGSNHGSIPYFMFSDSSDFISALPFVLHKKVITMIG